MFKASMKRTAPALLVCGCVVWAGLVTACGGSGPKQGAAEPGSSSGGSAAATRSAPVLKTAKTYTAYIDGNPTPAPSIPMGDAATIERILDEGANRNQVMRHLTTLCTEIGPRLTGSSNAEKANIWAKEQFEKWGLVNAHIEQWGEIPVRFDRGPSTGKVMASTTRERNGEKTTEWRTLRDMEFTTLAWAAGTNGPTRGRVMWLPESEEEYAKVKDQLKGAWILVKAEPVVTGARMRGGQVTARYQSRIDARKEAAGGADTSKMPIDDRVLFDGISGFISTSRDERVWTSGAPGWRELDASKIPQDVEVIVRLSDYDYMNSRLADGEEIYAEFDCKNTFTPGPIATYNTVADIPGTEKPDEYVIVSAHLDSWNGPGSLGTTDNGTGSCVTLEAARLLMASGAKPKRTIRFILWTGEEQGLLGSRAYVQKHPELLEKISAVFVDDGGTNYEGGLPALESMVPMLAAATAPVNGVFTDSADGKPLTVNIRKVARMPRGGASDHASFNAKKVPGFFWDEVGRADYGFGWHTQNDTLARAIPEYLMQSATCAAVTSYNLACAPTLLPREPKEEPAAENPSEGDKKPPTPPTPPSAPAAPATPEAPKPASPSGSN